jgi:hypothetical protein
MDDSRATPSPGDVAAEANTLLTGLGILTFQLFPIALPLLVLVIGPLALLAVVGLLVAAPLVLPLWLFRMARRAWARRRGGAQPDESATWKRVGEPAAPL